MPIEDQGLFPERYQIIPRVLVFATRGDSVLLLKGAPTKRLWANLYNGVGGHIEQGEDVLTAARREFLEETGLALKHAWLAALILIDTRQPVGIGMAVFRGKASDGELIPSAEGSLQWVPFDQIAQLPLVEDLLVLLPTLLQREAHLPPLFGRYFYRSEKLVIEFSNQDQEHG